MMGAVAEGSTAAMLVMGFLLTQYKYLHGLQVGVPGLAVCECGPTC